MTECEKKAKVLVRYQNTVIRAYKLMEAKKAVRDADWQGSFWAVKLPGRPDQTKEEVLEGIEEAISMELMDLLEMDQCLTYDEDNGQYPEWHDCDEWARLARFDPDGNEIPDELRG